VNTVSGLFGYVRKIDKLNVALAAYVQVDHEIVRKNMDYFIGQGASIADLTVHWPASNAEGRPK
jgi:D-mannonate dehydratase